MLQIAASTPLVNTLVDKSCTSTTPSSVNGESTDAFTIAVNAPKPHMALVPDYIVVQGCCVWHWKDNLSTAEGWIVIDSPVPTTCGGGLFLHDEATFDEVRDIARSMSAKLAVSSQPQIVGAKGGIRFPSRDSRAPLVLERFIRDHADIISQYWGTGGDINTDHAKIDEHAKAYCTPGTSTALDALRISLDYTTSAPLDIHTILNEKLDNNGWSLNDFSVGYVMATTLKELLSRTKPELMGRAHLVLQGFGCVGATFAEAAKQLGIGQVVAISSQYGFIINHDGIDCAAIEATRHNSLNNGSPPILDPRSLEIGLSQAQLHSDLYTPRRANTTNEEHLVDFLTACKAEVFVPCAQRYILTSSVVSTLINDTFSQVPSGARFILAGANNVFHPIERQEDTLAALDSAGIRMLPEWISNSGTCNLFMRACSRLALKGYAASTLDACANDTKAFINTVFANVGDKGSNKAIWEACESLAITRRKVGAVNLLGVKRMSHLTLSTFNVERAKQTITQVYNAKCSHDESLYQLPGSGDPTISVVKTPEGAGPARTGFSVRFSVYNLEKARGVLEAKGITFEERSLAEQTELVLTPEEAGYPMSLCQAPARELSNDNFFSSPDALTSVLGSIDGIDHYATIMPDAKKIKLFHERMLGFTALRTFTVNSGSSTDGYDDGLMHVMRIPFDTQRVVVLTEGLTSESVFSKLMKRKCGAHVHHIALKVDDVDAVFAEVRARGWATTSEKLSLDLATGLRQFFIKEEESGSILEFIGQGSKANTLNKSVGQESYANTQVEFRTENIVALAQSLDV